MRLIDADALPTSEEKCDTEDGIRIWERTNGMNIVIRQLLNAPTIDAVHVVRCDECWFRPKGKTYCIELERHTGDGFYCAFGQRREE
mgnify:CR=1 FL=1